MGKCEIILHLSEDAESMVRKAGEAIKKSNGEFTGDESAGAFQLSTPLGLVKGNYTIAGSEVTVQISNKPILVSCGRIEETLRSYMAG